MERFDKKALRQIAQRIRERDEVVALTAAATKAADLSRQPKLDIKQFQISDFEAAVSPDCSYRLMAKALKSAKTELLVYLYNIGADHMRALLAEALERKVSVRVMIDRNDPNDGKSEEWEKLKALGVTLQEAPSKGARRVFTVCHQKYVVIDRRVVVLASANWATSAIPLIQKKGQYKTGNREWFLRMDNVPIAQWFADLFQKDWDIPAAPLAGLRVSTDDLSLLPSETMFAALFVQPPIIFDSFTSKVAATVTPLVSPINYLTEVSKLLKKAKKAIDIQQQYIKAGEGVNELLQIVHARAKAGVRVRIVSSPKFDSWQDTQDTLRAAGLISKLKALDLKQFIHCHNKGVLVDDRYAVVSSTNWSENSITRAREAGVLVDSKEISKYFGSVFHQDWTTGLTPPQASLAIIELPASERV